MITLVLGGASSGKSLVAEQIVGALGSAVTYVATAVPAPGDADHTARITAHRTRRPASWATVECASADDLASHLRRLDGVALVDSLGSWIALKPGFDMAEETADLLAAVAERDAPTVLVSEEVGLAVHPPTVVGRRYAEAVGTLNQRVAALADRVLLVVAGRALELPSP
ncbi:MAG: bifunctional adenosylcobinamide kinase/adenosylcobinamide-phosphate guanylyltransferase [bacterium]|nr:bifunctional adenosylcobinamide kinase/adenosylcobinamide-phosphate guanylyltransferase [bacterium]